VQTTAQNGNHLSAGGAPPEKAVEKSSHFPAIGISAQATFAEPQSLKTPFPDSWVPQNGAAHLSERIPIPAGGRISQAPAGGLAGERSGAVDTEAAGEGGVASALTPEVALERLEGLLRRLGAEHDPENFFQEKVSTQMPGCADYYEKIKHPMWFSQMHAKVTTCCDNWLSLLRKSRQGVIG